MAGLFFSFDTQKRKKYVDSDRIAEYDMKLIGIPLVYRKPNKVGVTAASNEFIRIVRHDLSQPGDSFPIDVNQEGIRFTSEGEAQQW